MWPFKSKPRCEHNWHFVTAATGRYGGFPVTQVSKVCTRCGKAEAGMVDGYWTLDILNRDWVANPPKP